ncbi:helix-turn-helix domain-containing protein [Thiobacillus thioparus]|uniref:helix-turn-helix domain-containing protein n=1 Tax=Thiobacillus thioparus TaxID=931 RepID=UPI00037CF8F1|nr:helix-turn-helix domain-containing protein [Thiobacillus thioparus]
MEKEKGHPQAAQITHGDHNDNSAHTQRLRLLAAFETRHSLTTIEARRDLDILMPAARVFELRARGFDIATIWTDDLTECGRKHRVARYVMRKAAP